MVYMISMISHSLRFALIDPPRAIVTQLNKYWYPVCESYISSGAMGAWDFDLTISDRDYIASRLADYIKL